MHLHRTGQRTALAMVVIGVGVMLAECAQAQENCASRERLVAQLAEEFGEHQHAMALSPDGLVEVFVSAETGTWTILETHPSGLSCVASYGYDWTDAPKGEPS